MNTQRDQESQRRPSLAVIARAAGLSQATVSRVLRDLPGVSDSARRAVHVALATLGMDAAGPASPDSSGGEPRVPLLGIVQRAPLVAEIDRFERFGVELIRQAASRGIACLRCYVDAQTDWTADALAELGVSGVIALGAGGPARLAGRVAAAGMPTALVATLGAWEAAAAQGTETWSTSPGNPADPATATVAPTRFELDDVQGMRTALRHLLQLGHTRVGLAAALGPTSGTLVAEFRRSLAAGLHIVASRDQAPVALSEPTVVAGARAGETLLDAGCSAVVSCSPALTYGVLEATRRRGLRIPEHLSLLTVGEMPDADVLGPPLSQVAYDWQLLAAEVVNRFVARFARVPAGSGRGEQADPGYRIEPDLILRGSQAPLSRR